MSRSVCVGCGCCRGAGLRGSVGCSGVPNNPICGILVWLYPRGRIEPRVCFLAVVAARVVVAAAVEILARHRVSPGVLAAQLHQILFIAGERGSQVMVSLSGLGQAVAGLRRCCLFRFNGRCRTSRGCGVLFPPTPSGSLRHQRALSLRGLVSLSMVVPPPGCLHLLFCRAKKLCLLPRKVIAVFRYGNVKPSGFCIFFSTPSFFGVVKISHKLALFLSTPLCRAV